MATAGGAAMGANPAGPHFVYVTMDPGNPNAVDVYGVDAAGALQDTNFEVTLAC